MFQDEMSRTEVTELIEGKNRTHSANSVPDITYSAAC